MKTIFILIRNGEKIRQEFDQNDAWFNKFNSANADKFPFFGNVAYQKGEAPFKAIFQYTADGNIVGIRGDRYQFPNMVEMLYNLYTLAKKYQRENKIRSVKIYDNRNVLNDKLILDWSIERGTVVNMLPLYSGKMDILQKQKQYA
ncbi:MAG: hypothetical protein KF900_14090 [Bacteroidetes bacterium]|nr:hypothetical protein [Bacteroidota bacterium]